MSRGKEEERVRSRVGVFVSARCRGVRGLGGSSGRCSAELLVPASPPHHSPQEQLLQRSVRQRWWVSAGRHVVAAAPRCLAPNAAPTAAVPTSTPSPTITHPPSHHTLAVSSLCSGRPVIRSPHADGRMELARDSQVDWHAGAGISPPRGVVPPIQAISRNGGGCTATDTWRSVRDIQKPIYRRVQQGVRHAPM